MSCSERGCVLGAGALGSRGMLPHQVGRTAGRELARDLRAGVCVDTHAQDQLVLYMALAHGTTRVLTGPLSLHTRTAIHVAELFTQVSRPVPVPSSIYHLLQFTVYVTHNYVAGQVQCVTGRREQHHRVSRYRLHQHPPATHYTLTINYCSSKIYVILQPEPLLHTNEEGIIRTPVGGLLPACCNIIGSFK